MLLLPTIRMKDELTDMTFHWDSCAKHRRDDRSSAHFENASGFSISKGDFSAIRGHRYGGLRISGKTIVIREGPPRTYLELLC